ASLSGPGGTALAPRPTRVMVMSLGPRVALGSITGHLRFAAAVGGAPDCGTGSPSAWCGAPAASARPGARARTAGPARGLRHLGGRVRVEPVLVDRLGDRLALDRLEQRQLLHERHRAVLPARPEVPA